MRAVRSARALFLVFAIVVPVVAAAPASSAATFVVPSPAAPTIASALAMAVDGDSIDVLPGTYLEHSLTVTRTLTLRGVAGAAATIIDAQGLDRVIYLDSAVGVVIEGLTITHGRTGIDASVGPELTIRGCVITDNHTTGNGGGVRAGVGIGQFPLAILDSVLSDNSAGNIGGGLQTNDVSLIVTRCVFRNNTAARGGGAWFTETSGNITDCVLVSNTATLEGGGVFYSFGGPAVQGCTFYGNAAPEGGALRVGAPVTRTIIAATSTPPGHAPVTCGSSGASFTCCDLFGNSGGNAICGTDGGGNFSMNPFFCNPTGGDFRLNENSPCLPGHHPGGVDCGGTIGALGVGCGIGTGVDEVIEAAPWSRVKTRYH